MRKYILLILFGLLIVGSSLWANPYSVFNMENPRVRSEKEIEPLALFFLFYDSNFYLNVNGINFNFEYEYPTPKVAAIIEQSIGVPVSEVLYKPKGNMVVLAPTHYSAQYGPHESLELFYSSQFFAEHYRDLIDIGQDIWRYKYSHSMAKAFAVLGADVLLVWGGVQLLTDIINDQPSSIPTYGMLFGGLTANIILNILFIRDDRRITRKMDAFAEKVNCEAVTNSTSTPSG